MQNTSYILMIRPVNFGFNAETAVNNTFQSAVIDPTIQENALIEFDNFVNLLKNNGVRVTVIDDTSSPHTPDSIFPNNWISFHADGKIILYPMFAPNRRAERKQHVLDILKEEFEVEKEIDLSHYEDQNLFLEGTGSMVLDRDEKIAYTCISPRTNLQVLEKFCEIENYTAVTFTSTNINGVDIYHTNVMMCIAREYVVICLESITNAEEQQKVVASILKSGKEIIEISQQQLNAFAGNMLQVVNKNGERILAMSAKAFNSLKPLQREILGTYNRIIYSSLDTIEKAGGGSARCMMAEIFLLPK
jgi:hypothetical protein